MTEAKSSHEKVLDIVMKEDDLNWKDLIMDLVRVEGMNPWDIDVSLLSQRFVEMLTELKQMDFRVSGKMVLASSLLLKIKSDRLLLDGIAGLDSLINGPVEEEFLEEEDAFEYEQYDLQQFLNDQKKIVPRTPQPRERKVSVFDLVNALEQALDQDARRHKVMARSRGDAPEVKAPTKVFDLSETMQSISTKIGKLFIKPTTKIYFHDLLPESAGKQETVYTFLPLLHLENQRKVNLEQPEHFGPIQVLVKNREF